LINFGSYTICLEFIFVALCVALLAVGPPSIVAGDGAIPSGFPKAIVCVLGVIIVLWQFLGIFSIKTERTSLYRTYIRVNLILTLVTIVVTLAFFAVAAARHSTALTNCVANYGNLPAGSSTTRLQDAGQTICNIFIWVQVGCMGLLIVLIGLTQVSFRLGEAVSCANLQHITAVYVLLPESIRTRDEESRSRSQSVSIVLLSVPSASSLTIFSLLLQIRWTKRRRHSVGRKGISDLGSRCCTDRSAIKARKNERLRTRVRQPASFQSQEHLQSAPIGYNQRNSGIYSQNYPQYAPADNTASYESSQHQTSYDSQPDLHTQYGGSGGYRNPHY
jgi:hypothetical protein